AKQHYTAAIQMADLLYPDSDHPTGRKVKISCRYHLAMSEEFIGNLDVARVHMQQVLSETSGAEDSEQVGQADLATYLNRYGSILLGLEEFEPAREYLHRGLQIRRDICRQSQLPSDARNLAYSLSRIGQLVQSVGESNRAIKYQLEALERLRRVFPESEFPTGHSDIATALRNMGSAYVQAGDSDTALGYLHKAEIMWIELNRSEPGFANTRRWAATLQQQALAYLEIGDCDEAARSLERARSCYSLVPTREHDYRYQEAIGVLTGAMAKVHLAQQKYTEAERLARQTVELFHDLYARGRFSDTLGNLGRAQVELAKVLGAMHNYGEATECVIRGIGSCNRMMIRDLASLSESEGLNRRDALLNARSIVLSLWKYTDRAPREIYEVLSVQRALVHRAICLRQKAFRLSDSEATRKLIEEHRSISRDLARRLKRSSETGGGAEMGLLESLTEKKEELERQLARELPSYREWLEDINQSPIDLINKLPQGSACVEFIRYARATQFETNAEGEKRMPSYAAFVLQLSAPVNLVYLGDAKPIDSAALELRRAVLDGTDPVLPGQSLRRLVWDPIEEILAPDTQAIYICPDSTLTTVPWAALPQDGWGTPLLEKYAFAVVTSSSFLLDQLAENDHEGSRSGQFLSVGDVAFGERPGPSVRRAGFLPRALVRGEQKYFWRNLPATKRELAEIAALAAPRRVVSLRGTAANTENVAEQLRKSRWVHFATHGYFAHPRFRSTLQADDQASGEQLFLGIGGGRTSAATRNPLLLSGLVLAGANLPPKTDEFDVAVDDGGILTAEYISFLNLENLELAVLSACDTGLGDVAGGEGVLGLQRAFHTAGAKNVIASLWQVDDDATAVLMKLFYLHLWRKGKSPLESLRAAQLTLYRSPELLDHAAGERGIDFSKTAALPAGGHSKPPAKKTTPIHLWAAFILSGTGR
ncbi:MAG: CHAT domain-containing protein, partial [Pirellulaceae bacterium]